MTAPNRNNPTMALEMCRLESFKHWPPDATSLNASRLARRGFYVAGSEPSIWCYYCAQNIGNVRDSVDVEALHASDCPTCETLRMDLTPEQLSNQPLRMPWEILSERGNEEAEMNVSASEEDIGKTERINRPAAISSSDDAKRLTDDIGRLRVSRSISAPADNNPRRSELHESASRSLPLSDVNVPTRDDVMQRISGLRTMTSLNSSNLGRMLLTVVERAQRRDVFESSSPSQTARHPLPSDDALQRGNTEESIDDVTTELTLIDQLSRQPQVEDILQRTGVTHNIEPREVKARMDTPIVHSVLEMGYSRDLVRKVIEWKLVNTGDDFANVTSLLEVLFTLGDNDDVIGAMTQHQLLQQEDNASVAAHVAEENTTSEIVVNHTSTTTHDDPLTGETVTVTADASVLAEENQQLRDARTCKVCLANDVSMVFLPCGHLVCCDVCARDCITCPVCSTQVTGSVKVFIF